MATRSGERKNQILQVLAEMLEAPKGEKITPAALASPYVSGEYYHGKTIMYVSRGIGTVGIPVRLNCPPEITLITLRCSHGQGS